MTTTAIYYQKSEVVQEEFKLIEVATLREMVVEKLQRVIREVKENRRELDDGAMLETVTLFNKVREATVDIIRSISVWQESFTKPIRPRLLDCDYIIDRLIYHIDFINATKLRRVLNFQFYRGNFLLLPYPNPKTVEPFRVSTALGREIRSFASPPEETVLFCYQFLINCIPDAVYQDRVAPLKRWLMAGWIPRVYVVDIKPVQAALQKSEKPAAKRRTQGSGMASNKASAKDGDTTIVSKDSRRATSAAGQVGKSSSPTLKSPNFSPDGKPRTLQRSATVGSSTAGAGNNSSDKKAEEGGKADQGKTRIKRRNQMKEEETEQLKGIIVDPCSPGANPNNNSAPDLQELQLQEYLRIQQEKNRNEMSRLDTYFQEMELLFLPTLGRRAVQTVVVGGARVDNNQEYQEPITHDLFHQPEKIVFHHTFKEQKDELDAIIHDTTIPEQSNRVNAAIVTKRNRIMADRGQPTQDRKYENHKPVVDISSYKRKFDRSALLSTQVDVNPVEILFAAENTNDKESQKTAAAFLKNKYSTGGSMRSKSKDSSDGESDAKGSRRSSRRLSGVSLDTSVKSGASSTAVSDAEETNAAASAAPSSTVESVGIAAMESTGSSSRPPSAIKLPPISSPSSSSARGKRPGSAKGIPTAPCGDTQDSDLDEREQSESRRMRRRESRRMSDLTVTFSVNGGEVGAEDFLAMMEAAQPAESTAGAGMERLGSPHKPRGPPGSPQGRGGALSSGKRVPSPKHRSPPRGKASGGFAGGASMSPAKTVVDSGGKFRRPVTPPADSSDKSRASASKNSEFNEFGIRKKAGTPPKASLSLTLSTSEMRNLFANQEEADAQSQSTN